MALLKFNHGLVGNLPVYSTETVGNIYITKDSHEMKVDLPDGRISISDFIIVENQAALEALETYHENLFYYVKTGNILQRCTKTVTEGQVSYTWTKINDVSELESAISALGLRVLAIENTINGYDENGEHINGIKEDVTSLKTAVAGINASTIETTQDIVVTAAVGNYAKGKVVKIDDIQEIIKNMLSTDIPPSVTQPSASLSLTNAGAIEVGKTVTPSYSFSTSAGSYSQYRNPETGAMTNQSTGVKFSGYTVKESGRPGGNDSTEAKTTKTGSFDSFIVTDDVDYKLIEGACESTAGNVPKSYLGVDDTSKQIQAKTYGPWTTSAITGFRGCFYGYYNSKKLNPNALTSDQIRALIGNTDAKSSLGGYLVNGQVTTNKMQQMFFAAPAGKYSSIAVANSTNGAPQTVTKLTTPVYVKGYNNYVAAGDETTNGGMAYDVWYVDNAGAESGSTTFNVTIS